MGFVRDEAGERKLKKKGSKGGDKEQLEFFRERAAKGEDDAGWRYNQMGYVFEERGQYREAAAAYEKAAMTYEDHGERGHAADARENARNMRKHIHGRDTRALFAMIFLLLSFIFSVGTISGNVIGGNDGIGSYLGVALFLIGLVFGFVYLKKRR